MTEQSMMIAAQRANFVRMYIAMHGYSKSNIKQAEAVWTKLSHAGYGVDSEEKSFGFLGD